MSSSFLTQPFFTYFFCSASLAYIHIVRCTNCLFPPPLSCVFQQFFLPVLSTLPFQFFILTFLGEYPRYPNGSWDRFKIHFNQGKYLHFLCGQKQHIRNWRLAYLVSSSTAQITHWNLAALSHMLIFNFAEIQFIRRPCACFLISELARALLILTSRLSRKHALLQQYQYSLEDNIHFNVCFFGQAASCLKPKTQNQFLKMSFYTQLMCLLQLMYEAFSSLFLLWPVDKRNSSKSCYHRDQAQLLRITYGICMTVLKWLILYFSSPQLPVPLMDAHCWDL